MTIAVVPDGLEILNILSVWTDQLLGHGIKRKVENQAIALFLNTITVYIDTSLYGYTMLLSDIVIWYSKEDYLMP